MYCICGECVGTVDRRIVYDAGTVESDSREGATDWGASTARDEAVAIDATIGSSGVKEISDGNWVEDPRASRQDVAPRADRKSRTGES